MEEEALRLFKVLYDLSSNDQIDVTKGIPLKTLLSLAKSGYNSASSGRPLMSQLLYHLVKAGKLHFTFSVKGSTARRRRADDVIPPCKTFEEFNRHINEIKSDLEKVILINSTSRQFTRTDKLLELLYNKAKNFDTYAIYRFIVEAGPNGITYAQISQKYNQTYGPEKHLSSIKIANYCKKMLEKNGFIKYLQPGNEANSLLKGSERVVVLTKHSVKSERRECFRLNSVETTQKQKRVVLSDSMEESKKERIKQKITSHIPDLDKLKESTQGLTMRQIIGQSISSDFARKNRGLAIGEIAYILDMKDNKKAVNRVLEDMAKGNTQIYGSTEGSGKVRFNKYVLAEDDTTKVKIRLEAEGYYTKFHSLAAIILKNETNPIIEGLNALNELNSASMKIMVEIIGDKVSDFSKKYKKYLNNPFFKKLIVKTVLIGIIEVDRGQKQKKRREIATETINRYIFCLNKINEHKVLSMLELMNMITQELEKGYGILIARKTLKKITHNLTNAELIKTAVFTVNMSPNESGEVTASFTRYIFYVPGISADDEKIIAKSKADTKGSKSEPQVEKEEEKFEEIEVDIEACAVSIEEKKKSVLKKVLNNITIITQKICLRRYRDNVERLIVKKQLVKLFAPSKSLFQESVLSSLKLWRASPLPTLEKEIKETNTNTNKVIEKIKAIDKNIKVRERATKQGFESNLKTLIEPLITLGKKTSETSLNLLLKKCKNMRQGPRLIELLYMNGIIDIKKQPIINPAGIFNEDLVDAIELEDIGELSVTTTEYLTEMKKEETIIIPYNI